MADKPNRWSHKVTTDVLHIEPGAFSWDDPVAIAAELKRSAEEARSAGRTKGTVRQSAMSMLNFYINRAGSRLPEERRRVLEQAKVELRRLVIEA